MHFPVRVLSSKSSFVSWSTAFLGLCAGVAQKKSGRQYFRVLDFTAALMIQFAFPRDCLPILVDKSFADSLFVELTVTVLWLFDEGVV